jgi:hypothetical protein
MNCKCGKNIHPVRVKFGYNNCVTCSTTERYGCAPAQLLKDTGVHQSLTTKQVTKYKLCPNPKRQRLQSRRGVKATVHA